MEFVRREPTNADLEFIKNRDLNFSIKLDTNGNNPKCWKD